MELLNFELLYILNPHKAKYNIEPFWVTVLTYRAYIMASVNSAS